MDVALVLDQVENRAFDPSQASVHDGLSVDANLGSDIVNPIALFTTPTFDAPIIPGLSGIVQWCVECGRKYCRQSGKVSKTVSSSVVLQAYFWHASTDRSVPNAKDTFGVDG